MTVKGRTTKAKMKPGEKNKGGRPRKTINYRTLDGMCRIHCTGEECAAILGIDYDTLNSTLLREKGKSFSDYFAEKSAGGKRSLRRKQWDLALNEDDKTMLIWLGKQHLGQAEKHELTGKDGGPIIRQEHKVVPDLSCLTDKELAVAEKLGLSIKAKNGANEPG